MAKDDLGNEENYRMEYKEVAATYRFQISLRFIINGFTATLQSALLNTYIQILQKPPFSDYAIMIPYIGFIVMVAVFLIEQRTISVFQTMILRGKELEFNLGLVNGHFGWLGAPDVIRPKGLKIFVTHTWGIRLIYGIIFVMWIAILLLFYSHLI